MSSRDVAANRRGRVAGPANRGPLSKRAWQDVRRALSTQPRADVHAVELHGVKIIYNWKKKTRLAPGHPAAGAGETQAPRRGTTSQQHRGDSNAEPHAEPNGNPAAPRGNAKQRRSRTRLQEFLQAKRAAAEANGTPAVPAGEAMQAEQSLQ